MIDSKYNLDNSKIIELYNSNIPIRKIANTYAVDFSVISRILKINDIPLRRITKKYTFNESFFNVIDSQEKAYFLGFLYADGCNFPKEAKTKLKLHEQDIEILYKFQEHLELNNIISTSGKKYKTLMMNSPKICSDLERLGCTSKKSLTLTFPNKEQVPNNLIHHFMRGFFDGDGCVSDSSKFEINIVSTKIFLEQYQRILVEETGLNYTILQDTTNTITKRMKYSRANNLRKIYNFLYKDATIFLSRKYDKFVKNL